MKLDSKLARLAVAGLMLAFPLVYGLRVLGTPRIPSPIPTLPADFNLLVLTVGGWQDPQALPPWPSVDSLTGRGVRVGPVFAASDDPAASAVSLWTGRFVPHHGVVDAGRSLPPGAWTLASAARASGARTAAFLQAEFARRQGLAGFDQVVEGLELEPERLGTLAAEFLARDADARSVVWIHLAEPGPAGGHVERVLAPVLGELDGSGARVDTLTVLTALRGRQDAWMEGRARVPLLVELPTALNARRSSEGQLSHVHLTALLRRLMRLPGPDASAGQADLQAEPDPMWNAVRGGDVVQPVWIEGSFGHVWRDGVLRVQVDPLEEGALPTYDLRALSNPQVLGRQAPSIGPDQSEAARQLYLDARRRVFAGAVDSVTAPG
ncbi:MAG: hypothetical protein AAFZ65_10835 [Planctomycetota bacterium]